MIGQAFCTLGTPSEASTTDLESARRNPIFPLAYRAQGIMVLIDFSGG